MNIRSQMLKDCSPFYCFVFCNVVLDACIVRTVQFAHKGIVQ